MSFIVDKQTLDDLNLTSKYKSDSIFNLFNRVQTNGGEKLLEYMFLHPMSDLKKIKERSEIFRYFQGKAILFPFRNEDLNLMENYLRHTITGNLVTETISNIKNQVTAALLKDDQYETMLAGFRATVYVLDMCINLIDQLKNADESIYGDLKKIKKLINDDRLKWLKSENFRKLSLLKLTQYDILLRCTIKAELQELMHLIYKLDVYIAVNYVAKENGFTYATALAKEFHSVKMEEMRHPALKKAVGNSFSFHQNSNVCFLTGANMAGKSTLMKTFGISMYLAHMGFPVAAKEMEFSVKDGIYSSINVSDNLNMGYSHFYAEVLRVKKVAEEVSEGKNMIVIFDELFKGTNVKDAFDATLEVTAAFALYKNCFFIISTHIIEVGEELKKIRNNVRFLYLPTIMKGNIPQYTYILKEGVTSDRQGMLIIENEQILEILNN